MADDWKVGDVAVINKEYPSSELHGKVVVIQSIVARAAQQQLRVVVPADGGMWILYQPELDRP